MRFTDLSHTIEPGIPTFSSSAPQPKIYPWLSHKQSAHSGSYHECSCEITEVRLLTSIGTYIDSPAIAKSGYKLSKLVSSITHCKCI